MSGCEYCREHAGTALPGGGWRVQRTDAVGEPHGEPVPVLMFVTSYGEVCAHVVIDGFLECVENFLLANESFLYLPPAVPEVRPA